MPLTGVELPRFGGLDLRDDAEDVSAGGAVDLQNVMFSPQGTVRTRDGMTSLFSTAAGPTAVWWWSGRNRYVVASTGNGTYVYDATGTLQGSTATGVKEYNDFVPFSANAGYLTRSAGTGQIDKITSAGVVTSPAGMPANSSAICVQTPDNRLVSAYGDRVSFSGAGTPETFGATDWVDLQPNDGESLTQLVSWGNRVFAFKQNSFFVFYGNSVDGAGHDVFNYRRIAGKLGALDAGDGCHSAIAADDGVYFANQSGLWKTTGGDPVKVSRPVDPLFGFGSVPSYYLGESVTGNPINGLTKVGDTIFLQFGTSALSYDIATNAWTVHSFSGTNPGWGIGVTSRTGFSSGAPQFMFWNPNTSNVRMMSGATSDNGTAIVSRYRTGFWNPGAAGSEAVVREWLIDGTGSMTWKTAVNDSATLGTGATITLGTSPAIAQGRDRRAVRGRNVSFEISAASGAWSVSRVTANLRGQSSAGKKST